MHENMKTSMWHTGRSERTCRLPACPIFILFLPQTSVPPWRWCHL